MKPEIFKSFKEFGSRYCDAKPAAWGAGLDYNGSSNIEELSALLKCLVIRRTKDQVLNQLPAKISSQFEVEVDAKLKKQLQ